MCVVVLASSGTLDGSGSIWCNGRRLSVYVRVLSCDGACAMDKGVVTKYGEGGGGSKRDGHVKFYPYEKGGVKSFSHPEGGNKTFWDSFYN